MSVSTTTTVTVNKESLLQHIEDFFEPAVETIESEASALETRAVAAIKKFDSAELPIIVNFIETLGTQVGKAAFTAAISAAPLLATGGWAAAAATVGTAVVATATADLPVDTQVALQATQAALQVVKVANSTVTAGDAPTVAVIDAAQPAA